jgi:hypothetical protein
VRRKGTTAVGDGHATSSASMDDFPSLASLICSSTGAQLHQHPKLRQLPGIGFNYQCLGHGCVHSGNLVMDSTSCSGKVQSSNYMTEHAVIVSCMSC